MYKCNTEARSRHHCRGKAISITGVCVCNFIYPEHNAHAPYFIVICGLSVFVIYFSTLSHERNYFQKKKINKHELRVLIFSINLSETFPILRRIRQDIIINVHTSSCKVPVIVVII
jgi:hypothetical protein